MAAARAPWAFVAAVVVLLAAGGASAQQVKIEACLTIFSDKTCSSSEVFRDCRVDSQCEQSTKRVCDAGGDNVEVFSYSSETCEEADLLGSSNFATHVCSPQQAFGVQLYGYFECISNQSTTTSTSTSTTATTSTTTTSTTYTTTTSSATTATSTTSTSTTSTSTTTTELIPIQPPSDLVTPPAQDKGYVTAIMSLIGMQPEDVSLREVVKTLRLILTVSKENIYVELQTAARRRRAVATADVDLAIVVASDIVGPKTQLLKENANSIFTELKQTGLFPDLLEVRFTKGPQSVLPSSDAESGGSIFFVVAILAAAAVGAIIIATVLATVCAKKKRKRKLTNISRTRPAIVNPVYDPRQLDNRVSAHKDGEFTSL